MILVEIAAQGVRGFSASSRIPLKPGYWLLKPPTATAVPLCALASAILHSDGRGGDAAFVAPGAPKGKTAFTLLGNDSQTYRLLRELGGAGGLHKLDKAAGKFELVSEDSTEVAQFLKSQVGVPPKTAFEALFCLTPAQLPTLRPKPKGKGKAAEKPKAALPSAAAVEAASDVGAARAKLAELEQELALSKEVGEIQFKLDGLSSQAFELEQNLQSTEALKSKLKEGEAAYEAAPTPESLQLPADIVSRLERYPQMVAKRDEALAKLGAEREGTDDFVAPSAPEPLWRETRFLAGAGAGAAALLLGAVLSGWAKYIALLDIPAFGFSALVALQYVDSLQGSKKASHKGGRIEAREKKIRDQFKQEADDVQRAIQKLGVESHQEALDLLSRKQLLGQKIEELRAEVQKLELDPQFAAASAEYQRIKAEQEALNAQLLERGGSYFRDAREVERDISRTRESIQLAERGGGAAPQAAGADAAAPGEPLEDPTPAMLALAADLFTTDVAGVAALVKDRAAQYLAALTDKRFQGLDFERDGKVAVLAGGKRLAAGELAGRDLDVVYVSLRLTLLEKYSAKFKVPVLIDDGPYVDEAKLPLLGRMLKHLGTITQVLHVTGSAALAPVADGSANL